MAKGSNERWILAPPPFFETIAISKVNGQIRSLSNLVYLLVFGLCRLIGVPTIGLAAVITYTIHPSSTIYTQLLSETIDNKLEQAT